MFAGEYKLSSNYNLIDKIRITSSIGVYSIVFYIKDQKVRVEFDFNNIIKGKGNFINDTTYKKQHYISFIEDLSENNFSLVVVYLSTSYVVKYKFYFDNEELLFDMIINKTFIFKSVEKIKMLSI